MSSNGRSERLDSRMRGGEGFGLDRSQGGYPGFAQSATMKPSPAKPAPAPPRPDSDFPTPFRLRSLWQWLLERLCIYPSGD
jgi:hypothetical protein